MGEAKGTKDVRQWTIPQPASRAVPPRNQPKGGTSKGAATVTGGGFITLAATLATMNGKVPVAGMVLVHGIDRFMNEARAITNLFGNTAATICVAWWEGSLDLARVRAILDRRKGVEAAVLAEWRWHKRSC